MSRRSRTERAVIDADPVDGPPPGDGQGPGRRAAFAGVVADGGPPHFEEHLLGDLFGLGRIADHGPDEALNRAGQLGEDQIERSVVAAPGRREQSVHVLSPRMSGIRPGRLTLSRTHGQLFGTGPALGWVMPGQPGKTVQIRSVGLPAPK
jgi:hypothetical protein